MPAHESHCGTVHGVGTVVDSRHNWFIFWHRASPGPER